MTGMVEFSRRCLFRQTLGDSAEASPVYESTWAYYMIYPGTLVPTPGRYRIRMVFGQEANLNEMDDRFFIHSHIFVEQWKQDGWMHCLDYFYDPSMKLSILEIESDINEMFKSFITGHPLNEINSDESFDKWPGGFPPPEPQKKHPKPKPGKGKSPIKENDFDWI